MKLSQRAFTLIELIVVIAVLAVMMGLLIIPVVQSFNFTRAAQGMADGQERARRLIERASKDIEQGASVRDNAGIRGQVALVVPDFNGVNTAVIADYAKLIIAKPLEGNPSLRDASGAYINPFTGVADPTLKSSIGQPVFPAAPGATVVVYYIALKKPLAANDLDPGFYYNPWIDYKRAAGVLWSNGIGEDNLYVLRRAEVAPMVWQAGTLVVNQLFFEDLNGDNRPDYDDPYFMVQDPPGFLPLPPVLRQAKAARMKNWMRASTIVTEFSRFDMIQPMINKTTRQILTTNGVLPRISTLVQFKPAAVANEPAREASTHRLDEGSDNMSVIESDVFKTKDGAWSSAIVRIHSRNYDPNNAAANEFFVCSLDPRDGTRAGRVYAYDPDLDPDLDDRNGEGVPADDIEVFDIGTYQNWAESGWAYPFTRAMQDSNSRSGWLGIPAIRNRFMPFFPHVRDGKLTTSFKIEEWGIDNAIPGTPPPAAGNLPFRLTGQELTPTTDPAPLGNFYDALYLANINRHFNKVWFDNPGLRTPGGVHRFIDLRVTPSADGAVSPLHPDSTIGFPQAQIVPGSDIVMGPDQNPGPNYGQMMKYTRVTKNPSRNQYKINYTNIAEPNYALLGFANPPAVYDPTNFVSAVIQARYKVGYMQFNSDPNLPLPGNVAGNLPIRVSYRLQFNVTGDNMTVDYDTRSQIDILLTIRNYPQSSLAKAAMITVKGSAPVRNLVR